MAIALLLITAPLQAQATETAPTKASQKTGPATQKPLSLPFPLISSFRTFGKEQGLPSLKVNAIEVAGKQAWAGTDRGLAHFTEGRWQSVPLGGGAARQVVLCLSRDPVTKDLWIGTFHGLARLSAGRVDAFTQLDSGLPNDVVYAVMATQDAVWAATAAGVGRRDKKTGAWRLYDHTNTLMHEPWCYALTRDSKRIYVGVWAGGIVEHDIRRRTWKEHRDPDGEMELDLLPDDGPIHDVTSSVSFAQGMLWQGTYFGLSRYDGRRWRSWVAEKSDLPSNFINYVVAHGPVAWIATDRGLCVTDGASWANYSRGPDGTGVLEFNHLGKKTTRKMKSALPHNEVLGLSLGESELWIATSQGVARGTLADTPKAGRSKQERGR